jgi:L-asparaginase
MRDLDRETLVTAVKANSAQQIVITHGTDTMIKTGQALTAIKGKTLVLTGAMRPALFRDSDADFNLGAAVTAA